MVKYVYVILLIMSDKFVKKQMYQCPKCDAIFSTKEEAAKHYDVRHDFAEKYLGAYIMSNNGKYFGKILWEDRCENQSFVVELFRFESKSKILSNTFSTFVTKYTITLDELESDFKVVTPEIVKKELADLFVQTGFTALKNNIAVGKDFKELFESDYREKGDDDGN